MLGCAARGEFMAQPPDPDTPIVLSYLGLRKAIGIIGMVLPFALALGKMIIFWSPGLQPSISDYYYTGMRGVFVGSLCSIAVFLMSYCGYPGSKDHRYGILAGVAGVGIALFPTTPKVDPSSVQKIIGGVHYTFAACFFLTLAYFCLKLFTSSNRPEADMTPRKKQRNTVYRACGWTIVGCLVLIVVNKLFLDESPIQRIDPVFWLESFAIVAFAFSWLTKGEAIAMLNDL